METLNIKRNTSNIGFAIVTGILCLFILLFFMLKMYENNPIYPLLLLPLSHYFLYARKYLLTNRKSNQLIIGEDTITLYDSEITVDEIDSIVMHGRLYPTYGIKLKNKKMISPLLQFKFAMSEIKHEDAFTKWAKEKNIPLVNREWMIMW